MKLPVSRAILTLVVLLFIPFHLRADAVYTLTGSVNWSFDVPSLLTGNNTFEIPESLITSQSVSGIFAANGCSVTLIFVEPFNTNFTPPAGILTTHMDCTGPVSEFGYVLSSDTPFLSFGTYPLSQGASLDITQTPEPNSFALLAAGVIAVLAMFLIKRY